MALALCLAAFTLLSSQFLVLVSGVAASSGEDDSEQCHIYTVLLVDTSESINSYITDDTQKITAIKESAHFLIWLIRQYSLQQAEPGIPTVDEVALVSYSNNAEVLSPFTRDFDAVDGAIEEISTGELANLGDGLAEANRLLENTPEDAVRSIIIIADGENNFGSTDKQILSAIAAQTEKSGVRIFPIGFDKSEDSLDGAFLDSLAEETGGLYRFAKDPLWLNRMIAYVRLSILGGQALEWTGEITPGQEIELSREEIFESVGEIHLVSQPGQAEPKALEVDPNGKAVGEDYPGASSFIGNTADYTIVNQPEEGEWSISVLSDATSESQTSFYLTFCDRSTPKESYSIRNVLLITLGVLFILALLVFSFPVAGKLKKRKSPGEGSPAELICAGCGAEMREEWLRCPYCGRERLVAENGDETGAGDCYLSVLKGAGVGGYYRISLSTTTIGSDDSNNIVLEDSAVSPRHARIYKVEGGCFIEDLGSKNGTFVDGRQVEVSGLREGSIISIGNSFLRLRMPGAE